MLHAKLETNTINNVEFTEFSSNLRVGMVPEFWSKWRSTVL